MKSVLLSTALVAFSVLSAHAQDSAASVELGLGVSVDPTYPGADDNQASPWLIWRNVQLGGGATPGDAQGFSFSPSFNTIGERDPDDDDALAGLDQIDRAYEFGGQVNYGIGPVTAYGSLRKGFGGHEGLVGSIGAKYRTEVNDRLTLWSGLALGYGDDEYTQTYFGVSPSEAASSGYAEYSPGGGFNTAIAKLEARYALTDSTALLGEVEYGRLIGDAADSPIVQDRDQPSVRLGIVRKFSFGF